MPIPDIVSCPCTLVTDAARKSDEAWGKLWRIIDAMGSRISEYWNREDAGKIGLHLNRMAALRLKIAAEWKGDAAAWRGASHDNVEKLFTEAEKACKKLQGKTP